MGKWNRETSIMNWTELWLGWLIPCLIENHPTESSHPFRICSKGLFSVNKPVQPNSSRLRNSACSVPSLTQKICWGFHLCAWAEVEQLGLDGLAVKAGDAGYSVEECGGKRAPNWRVLQNSAEVWISSWMMVLHLVLTCLREEKAFAGWGKGGWTVAGRVGLERNYLPSSQICDEELKLADFTQWD